MELTTIHLLRHGEVDNPDGILYGRLPGFGLTPLGAEMAVAAADYLVDEGADITHVISSPLQRAQETAAPTAAAYDLPVQLDPRLIEAGNNFEGLAINQNRWSLAHPRHWGNYRRLHEPSWGEPYQQIADRMMRAVASALRQSRGHEALLVSHQLPVVTVQRSVQGKPLSHNPLSRNCSLASLTSLIFDGDTLIGWDYAEPALDLLQQAQDMTPGASDASLKR